MSYLMNDSYVIDTHALYFYLTKTGKIKASVDDIFDRFDNKLNIPLITKDQNIKTL